MAVLIGRPAPRSTIVDDAALELDGVLGIHALSFGGRSFVYVASEIDDGLSGFELRSDGSLTNTQNITDVDPLKLHGAASVTSAIVNGVAYIYVGGDRDDGISVFKVEANGRLRGLQNISDDDKLELNGTEGKLSLAKVGQVQFLVATGDDDNGFSVFQVNADGTLTNTANVDDDAILELDNALDEVIATVGGNTFVFIAGEDDNGLSGFELHADGTVTNTVNVQDDGILNLWGAAGLASATVAGVTYLVASGGFDDGLSVFRVDGSGRLANVHNLSNRPGRGLDGPQGLTTFTLQGETFVAVSAATDGALSVFHLGAGGRLTDVTAVFDTADTALRGSRYNDFVTVGGVPLLLATGQSDAGVSTFELGGAADRLKGGAAADLLLGLAGNDNLQGGGGKDVLLGGLGQDKLLGGAGRDRLEGGGGADDFVFTRAKDSGPSGGKRDRIEDFGGKDDIDLRRIDADTTQKGNQAFALDQGGGFEAGEISLKTTKAGVTLQLNLDNDARAEMSIQLLDPAGKINDADFLF